MPTFDTPTPISVTISLPLVAGDVRITAGERHDTVVLVRPTDSSSSADVKAAEETRVEYSDGRLTVAARKRWTQWTPFAEGESVDVEVELPAGSHVHCSAGMGDVSGDGRLGECRVRAGAGNVRLDETGPLHLTTGAGSVTVGRVVGPAEVTGSGDIRIREIDGPAVVKNLNGDTWLGTVTGDLRCKAANGNITADRALSTVSAKSANGDVRILEVTRGAVDLGTANGELEVGVADGTAALLDVRTQFGTVRNSLTASDGPEPTDQAVEVRARSSYGDIVIRRS